MSYAFTILFAVLSGWWDARAIKRQEEIDHGVRWAFRAMVVGIACCIAMMFTDRTVWHVLPLAVGCGFLFSAVFLLSLNLLRGLDWRYLGPRLAFRTSKDSRYDGTFHLIAQRATGLAQRTFQRPRRRPIWIAPSERAGLIAYAFELVVFALTLLV